MRAGLDRSQDSTTILRARRWMPTRRRYGHMLVRTPRGRDPALRRCSWLARGLKRRDSARNFYPNLDSPGNRVEVSPRVVAKRTSCGRWPGEPITLLLLLPQGGGGKPGKSRVFSTIRAALAGFDAMWARTQRTRPALLPSCIAGRTRDRDSAVQNTTHSRPTMDTAAPSA
jgi:hypothetical protein